MTTIICTNQPNGVSIPAAQVFSGQHMLSLGGKFDGADMVDANLRGANCNGTSFKGADLRSVDFTGAQMFGAIFCDENGGGGAIVDGQTLISEEQLTSLTDVNAEYLRKALSAAP